MSRHPSQLRLPKCSSLAEFINKVDAEANNDVEHNFTKRNMLFVDNDRDNELSDVEPRAKRARTFTEWKAEKESKVEVDGAVPEGHCWAYFSGY